MLHHTLWYAVLRQERRAALRAALSGHNQRGLQGHDSQASESMHANFFLGRGGEHIRSSHPAATIKVVMGGAQGTWRIWA